MSKTLLLADDSVTIQKVVGISFANEDVVLLTVDNGDDAVARAREARPDVVLADVMMPGKDGYEVCEILKTDPELRHVPVLLLSGTFEPFDEERARQVGADGHITKPFEAQALVDQVNALLARAVVAPKPLEMAVPSDATLAIASEPGADAFDFFDDDMARTAPSVASVGETRPRDAGPAEVDEPVELEAAVEDEEPVLRAHEASNDDLFANAGDSQATMLLAEVPPAAPPFLGDGFEADALDTPAPSVPPMPASREAEAPAGYEESFDFGFDDGVATATTPVLSAAPAAAFPAPPPPAATRLFEDEDELEEPFTTAPVPPAMPAGPVHAPAPPPPPVPASTPPPVPELARPPVSELARPVPDLAPPPAPAVAAPPVSAPAALSASAPVAVPVSGPTALSAPAQKQLQETLEKIVWEAFGDLTERIVRDVIERVEAVAWEAIPQMAETLIREEIRRLKGEEDS